jgi:Zn-dependent M28 family amino/carboxypeptidase
MITNAPPQGDSIAALHLESLFNVGQSIRDKSAIAWNLYSAWPSVHEGYSSSPNMAKAASSETSRAAAFRAAANVATWRTYLPDECVVAMIHDKWHWST